MALLENWNLEGKKISRLFEHEEFTIDLNK